VVDLHPSGSVSSLAWGVGGGQQVGFGVKMEPSGRSAGSDHALLWRGSAAGVVDLTPSGFEPSAVFATNGEEQVGRAGGHAVLWRGSADGMIDLHTFLPLGFGGSEAMGIDSSGNVVGDAGEKTSPRGSHVFLWRRNVPKPTTSQGQITVICK
jgi:hypothetical protein